MADLVTTALQQVVTQVQEAGATLVPVGTATAGGLIILAVLMLGAAIAGGHAAFVGPIVRLCGAAAGTLWTIATWPTIVGDTYRASLEIQARLGGAGMLGLYSMAADIAARILAQGGSVSLLHPVDSVGQAITCGMAAFLILLGMGVDGVLVLLAQVEFLLGAAVAPLLLPGLAFGLTSQIGWGAVYALVRGAVRVIATGAAVGIMARACAAVVAVPGTDQVLSWAQMAQLMTLAVGTAMVGFVAYRLAGQVVGSPGVLGTGSVARVGSAAAVGVGGAAAAGRMAGAAVGMAAAAPAALAGMAGRFGGGGGGGAGSVGTASAGSPFSSQASGGAGAASPPSGFAGSSGPAGQSGPVGRSGPAGSAFSAGSRP